MLKMLHFGMLFPLLSKIRYNLPAERFLAELQQTSTITPSWAVEEQYWQREKKSLNITTKKIITNPSFNQGP